MNIMQQPELQRIAAAQLNPAAYNPRVEVVRL
jgi:hypothetical protein